MAKKRKRTLKKTDRPPLSAQEVRFCRLFVELDNATEAADQAGFNSTNRVALASRAFALLKKPQIAACIRRMQQQAADAEQITVNKLAQSLDREAHADRTLIFDSKGGMLAPNKWPDELRALVVGLEVIETPARHGRPRQLKYKVRFASPTEAKRMLAQWRGMLGDKDQKPAASTDRVNIVNDNGGGNDTSDGGDQAGGTTDG